MTPPLALKPPVLAGDMGHGGGKAFFGTRFKRNLNAPILPRQDRKDFCVSKKVCGVFCEGVAFGSVTVESPCPVTVFCAAAGERPPLKRVVIKASTKPFLVRRFASAKRFAACFALASRVGNAAGFSPRSFYKKAQVSVEFLTVAAVLLLFIGILAGVSFVLFSDSVASNQAKEAVNAITDVVNQVYRQGEGNVVTTKIVLPQSLLTSFVGGVSGKEFGFSIGTAFGDQNYVGYTDSNLAGSLPSSSGTFIVKATAQDQNVLLGQVG